MDATRVNLSGGWNIIWGAISGALGGVGGALTVLGTLVTSRSKTPPSAAYTDGILPP